MSSPSKSGRSSPSASSPNSKTSVDTKETNKTSISQTSASSLPSHNFEEPLVCEDRYYDSTDLPQFIYGGPFIVVKKPDPFLDTATPINIPLQGTFKKSYAYTYLKDKLPVIITKVIDETSIKHPEEIMFINRIAKLKNDLITNKRYELLKSKEDDVPKWNLALQECDIPKYFTNSLLFTECYVYRRIIDACHLSDKLKEYDPFESQKEASLQANIEAICQVADRVKDMLALSEDPQRKEDFILLLKINLWSNKVSDLALSWCKPMALGQKTPTNMPPPPPPGGAGSTTGLRVDSTKELPKSASGDLAAHPGAPTAAKPGAPPGPPEDEGPPAFLDPIKMAIDNQANILVDDSNKFCDQIVQKAQKLAEKLAETTEEGRIAKCKCDCHKLSKLARYPECMDEEQLQREREFIRLTNEAKAAREKGGKGKKPALPKRAPPPPLPLPLTPCPAKALLPRAVQFDIVCDNYGYELFCDFCLAHFLIEQKIVTKVRFHVKKFPWFVSDVTPEDVKNLIKVCSSLSYSRVHEPPKPVVVEGQPPPPPGDGPTLISSEPVNGLARAWDKLIQDGVFVIMSEDFWTMPHVYNDMKKYDYWMYRKLQYAVGILFKGDLNYRKLLGGKNTSPYATFESSLDAFLPAPILAIRTVKSEVLCGMKRGGKKNKFQENSAADPLWMTKGDFGVIQYSKKAEKLKVADRPCAFYCGECMGLACPNETPFW